MAGTDWSSYLLFPLALPFPPPLFPPPLFPPPVEELLLLELEEELLLELDEDEELLELEEEELLVELDEEEEAEELLPPALPLEPTFKASRASIRFLSAMI